MTEVIKKKRGRKPKNVNNLISNKIAINEDEVISEEEKVILHLPISIDKLNSNVDDNIFIKPESVVEDKNISSESSDTLLTNYNSMIYNNVNKILTHNLVFDKNTKCWWCRNTFDTPSVQLPDDYYNDTFYCIGNFCSFSCCKSYNSDNVNTLLISKRESLLNLLYYMTYKRYDEIIHAPHWTVLKEYGGILSINDFRKNLLTNTKEYLVLHPPLISRQMQIEESYKLNKLKAVPINSVNKLYSDMDSDYNIKRTKPIESNKLNLETTMGLIKEKNRK
jgi:hypothetical protein